MSDYKPGSGYDAGFKTRMNGGEKPSNVLLAENNVYWTEWLAGWDDAHSQIISESRARNTCSNKKCCKNKKFIQD
jgi:hypothetical protein